MTPDGTPIIGPTPVTGLWINSGHGTLGWTQSFASAELICSLVAGERPVLDAEQYALARYGRADESSPYIPYDEPSYAG